MENINNTPGQWPTILSPQSRNLRWPVADLFRPRMRPLDLTSLHIQGSAAAVLKSSLIDVGLRIFVLIFFQVYRWLT